ncbi:MerR family transcriptional regulator [Lactobacillaceae bacterium Melli_B4]
MYGCKLLRSTGIPLKQLKRYIDLYRIGNSMINDRYQLLISEKEQALKKLAEAKRNVDFLNERIEIYEDAIKNNKDLGSINSKGNYNDEK